MKVIHKPYTPTKDFRRGSEELTALHLLNKRFDCRTYLPSMQFFIDSSNEKPIITDFLKSEIVPSLPARKKMLDIGAGKGEITGEVGKSFNKVLMIEPGRKPRMQESTFKRMFSPKYTHIDGYFPLDTPPANDFNLVLGSHVLYYSGQGAWIYFIECARDLLSKGGKTVFIMNDDIGQAGAMNIHFGGETYGMDRFVQYCSCYFNQEIKSYELQITVQALTYKEMMRNAMFYLFNSLRKIKPDELLDYVKTQFLQPDGTYEMRIFERAFVIEK
ncbi:MAG: hypothetical protein WC506_05555 [Candidatus Micrarchaeia archaeon]